MLLDLVTIESESDGKKTPRSRLIPRRFSIYPHVLHGHISTPIYDHMPYVYNIICIPTRTSIICNRCRIIVASCKRAVCAYEENIIYYTLLGTYNNIIRYYFSYILPPCTADAFAYHILYNITIRTFIIIIIIIIIIDTNSRRSDTTTALYPPTHA